jgi:hypothetical protein
MTKQWRATDKVVRQKRHGGLIHVNANNLAGRPYCLPKAVELRGFGHNHLVKSSL